LATSAERTVLPGWMALGSTWPEKRSTSTFWFTPICFSPVISKCPLGRTSVTTEVMTPEKSLVFSVLPLPAKVLLELPSAVARMKAPGRMPGSAVTPAEIEPPLSMELVLFWLAATFSTICTVSVSPTRRARWSSNSGRYWLVWKIAPLLGGASGGIGRALGEPATSTLGTGYSVSQPASPRQAMLARASNQAFITAAPDVAASGRKSGSPWS
jgi:hypothetical protein